MISVPLIDELRETRRRLADECGGDLDHYVVGKSSRKRMTWWHIASKAKSSAAKWMCVVAPH